MTQPGYPQQYYVAPPEDTILSVLAHLSLFAFGLIAPLIMFLVVKDDPTKPMTRHHAAEALNFHLSLTLYTIVGAVPLVMVMVFLVFTDAAVLVGLLVVLAIAVSIGAAVLAVLAAVAAGSRRPYRYPLTIRFVR